MHRLIVCCSFLLVALTAPPAISIQPESGMFWRANFPGRGYYVDVQNGVGFLVIYAYDEETGKAEIYVADGVLRDDAAAPSFGGIIHPPLNTEGYYPLHGFAGDLYRIEGGPCLTCISDGDSTTAERVGFVGVWFPWANWVSIHFLLDDGRQYIQWHERLNWGRLRLVGESGSLRMHDLRGQWLFVDQSDPLATPWRFDFDEMEPETSIMDNESDVVFRDSRRGAEFRCHFHFPLQLQAKMNGCELYQDGEVHFSAYIEDLGLNRMQAFLGELPRIVTTPPLPQPEYWRGQDTVIGVRVEMPPHSEDDVDGGGD